MTTALVRIRDDCQVVGMFSFTNLMDLFWLIDECTDPYQCEFIRIEHGGIYFPNNADKLYTWKEIKDKNVNLQNDSTCGDMTAELTENLAILDDKMIQRKPNKWQNFDGWCSNVNSDNKEYFKKLGERKWL